MARLAVLLEQSVLKHQDAEASGEDPEKWLHGLPPQYLIGMKV